MISDPALPHPMPVHRRVVQVLLVLCVIFMLFAGGLWAVAALREGSSKDLMELAAVFSFFQVLFGVFALIAGVAGMFRAGMHKAPMGWFIGSTLGGLMIGAGGVVGFFISLIGGSSGSFVGGWGRPLRINGKTVSPDLKDGTDWAKGAVPDVTALNAQTRTLLATLWHRDATKEHSSVPAFCRIGWVLAALGAPAELLEGAAKSTSQEIDHTRRCLALAGGYCGTPQTVEPMPKLLTEGLGMGSNPRRELALESLRDGCLLEDFNADLAAIAHENATDPAAKELAGIIARDEREHAEVSWGILTWLLETADASLHRDVAAAAERLSTQAPSAYLPTELPLLEGADRSALVAHGRVPAEQWPVVYAKRLQLTHERLAKILNPSQRMAA